VKSIAPQAWLPADIPAFVHVAPVEVAWQLQPSQVNEFSRESPPPPPLVIEAPAGSVMVTVTWPLAAEPVSLTPNATVPSLPELWLHTLTVAVSCTVAGGVGTGGFGGLCVGCGLALRGCDVTVGAGLDAEYELLGAGLWLGGDLAGDADGTGVVAAGGDASASACGL
jgi:hypothetical protein